MVTTTKTGGGWRRRLVDPISINFGILLLRVWVGAALITHGHGKVFGDTSKLVEGVAHLGFPAPEFFAWAAALSEFGGGILLILGLGTRFAAIMIIITMAVAAFLQHASDPFAVKELALGYLATTLVIFILGPGRFSIDGMLARRSRNVRS